MRIKQIISDHKYVFTNKIPNHGCQPNILQSSHIFVAGLGMREKGYKKVGTHVLDIKGGGGLIQPFYNFLSACYVS